MTTLMSLFFSVVGMCIAAAASLQFLLYSKADTLCAEQLLGFAPLVAGGCLAVSFLTNLCWLLAKRKQWSVLARVSLFVWVVLLTTGLIAVGATLGQSQLYSTVCPDLAEVMKDDYVNLLQSVSVVLLILSIATPHIYPNKLKTAKVAVKSSAEEDYLLSNPIKPLNFL